MFILKVDDARFPYLVGWYSTQLPSGAIVDRPRFGAAGDALRFNTKERAEEIAAELHWNHHIWAEVVDIEH